MRRDFYFNRLSVVGARGDGLLRRGGDDWFLRFGCIFNVLQFLSYFLIGRLLFVKGGNCATVEILGRGVFLSMRAYKLALSLTPV